MMRDAIPEAIRRQLDELYGPEPEPQPPAVPPSPTPDMTPRDAAIAERRRLRFLGLVDVVDHRPDGRVLLYVRREEAQGGGQFHALADSDDPADVCAAVDTQLRRRVERDRAIEAERVDRLRRTARRAEDDVDRRHIRDRELERLGAHDRHLATAEQRLERVDGDLFQKEAS
jgi:hypothetical protein